MRSGWMWGVATTSVFTTVFAAGCSANVDSTAGDERSDLTLDTQAYTVTSIGRKVQGSWQDDDGPYPRLELKANRSYSLDSGIRCVRAPCPGSETGDWSIYKSSSGRYYVDLVADSGNESLYRVTVQSGDVTQLTGAFGTSGTFVRRANVTTCAQVRCAAGTRCEDLNGTVNAQCIAVTTCLTAKCSAGNYCYDDTNGARCIAYKTCANSTVTCSNLGESCVDAPIKCVTAPCAPTAPACAYACPASGYIDCMPRVPSSRAHLCSGSYHQWIVNNCPNVDFIY